ncbi:MAG TPA: hypothetical protein VGQ00_01220 [Candidatus Norongarragalinales archaeon]|nr:hypothetical protein [Candidatus Norongarragalinales archaeon]
MTWDRALERVLDKVPNPHPKLVASIVNHPRPEAKLKELLSKENLKDTLKRNAAWLKTLKSKESRAEKARITERNAARLRTLKEGIERAEKAHLKRLTG